MASLFGNFLDKDNPVKRLEKEIQNTEFKKQSLIAPFQMEINAACQKIDNLLYQIGKNVYEGHESGEDVGDKLAAHFEEIALQKALILEKETRIREFSGRYDEEISILRANLTAMTPPPAQQGQPYYGQQAYAPPPPPPPTQDGRPMGYCGNCGKPYAMGEDVFCMNCGQKLEQ